MGILEKYPHIKDWLIGKKVCDYKNLEEFFDKFKVPKKSILREGAKEFVEQFCKEAKKPFRFYFKSKNSVAKMLGIDKLGRKFAIGRNGKRISTKWYKRFFPE